MFSHLHIINSKNLHCCPINRYGQIRNIFASQPPKNCSVCSEMLLIWIGTRTTEVES